MTKLTIQQIKDAQIAFVKSGGGNDDSLQAKYYARPVSYYIAWLFIRLGITANQTTLVALYIAVIGGVLLTYNSYLSWVIGALLFNVGHLLDYADGTIAKATGTVSKFGVFLDKTCDEVVESIIPISLGIGLYSSHPIYLVIGFTCAVFHLLGALTAAYAKSAFGDNSVLLTGDRTGRLLLVGANVKSSIVPLLLVFVLISDRLPIFLIGFTLLSLCEFAIRLYSGVLRK